MRNIQKKQFHNIFTINLKTVQFFDHINLNLIPIKWKIILLNDGSFTQNLNSLTGKNIKLEVLHKLSNKIINKKQFRAIWLKDYKNNNLAYAESLWFVRHNKNIILNNTIPVGKLFIQSKTEIYKDIHQIYYGYSKYLEKKFNIQAPIWGRKYTIYSYNKSIANIQEFFSPYIINLFNI